MKAAADTPATTQLPRSKFWKLRIAWSVFWGVVAVSLVCLWVRSYWRFDQFGGPIGSERTLYIYSGNGHLEANYLAPPTSTSPDPSSLSWGHKGRAIKSSDLFETGLQVDEVGVYHLTFPYAFPSMICLGIAGIIWLPYWSKRFSLRTLLIATTLAALMLGAIIYIVR